MRKLLIGIDTGKVNVAYSIITKLGDLVEYGMLENKITDFKDIDTFNRSLNLCKKELNNIVKKYKNDKCILVYERFIPRFMQKGNIGEIANINIGLILDKFKYVKAIPVVAQGWKTKFKNKGFIEKKKSSLDNNTCPDHILDSICICLYYLWNQKMLTLEQIAKRVKYLKNLDFGYKYNYKRKIWMKLY